MLNHIRPAIVMIALFTGVRDTSLGMLQATESLEQRLLKRFGGSFQSLCYG